MVDDRFAEKYWDYTYDELSDEFDVSPTTLTRWRKQLGLPKKTEWNRVEYQHGIPMERILYHLHHDALMTTPEIADSLDISRPTLAEWFQDVDVDKRSRSEAEKLKNERMTEEERRQQTEAARKKAFEKYGGGGYVEELWEEQPDEQMEHVREICHLGAEAREHNGMEGVTGSDHPRWSGGKGVIDAVRKCIGDESWEQIRLRVRDAYDWRCQQCEEQFSGGELDVHHIIPISAGGTNEMWNLLPLCKSCHTTVERYIGFESVLVA